jgi:hypothetical protein
LHGVEEVGELPRGTSPSLVTSSSQSTPLRSRRGQSRGTTTSRRELREQIDSLRKQRLALAVTTAGFLALSIALSLVMVGGERRAVEAQTQLLYGQERVTLLEAGLADAQQSLSLSQMEIEKLVKGRIPGLFELELDREIPLEAYHVVRDVTFTQLEGTEPAYEFRAVIENRSPQTVKPTLKVLLFDNLGIQVGRSQVAGSSLAEERFPTLRPGEIRSVFSVIQPDLDRKPVYFLLVEETEGSHLEESPLLGMARPSS